MVKLNAEVIHSSHQYTNAIKERELDLRGNINCEAGKSLKHEVY